MDNLRNLEIGERLVAKQAILTFRAFKQALRAAPPDQRMEALDRAVRRQGQEHLRVMMAAAIAAQNSQGASTRLADRASAAATGRLPDAAPNQGLR